MVEIKGREYMPVKAKDSFNRRALQYRNNLLTLFRKIGLSEDDVDVSEETVAFRNAQAHASWYIDGRHMHFSYSKEAKYVDNLYMVWKVIEREVLAVMNDEQTLDAFIDKFAEDRDVATARKHARETLGVSEKETDLDVINRAYKKLAVEHHPDKDGGDVETFKKINNAHKLLKRELS